MYLKGLMDLRFDLEGVYHLDRYFINNFKNWTQIKEPLSKMRHQYDANFKALDNSVENLQNKILSVEKALQRLSEVLCKKVDEIRQDYDQAFSIMSKKIFDFEKKLLTNFTTF